MDTTKIAAHCPDRGREPQYAIILTDLADTQYRTFPKPRVKLGILVLLGPAQPKDAG